MALPWSARTPLAAAHRRARRARRGVEAVEFALILPLFIVSMFMSFEMAWYMFQRNGVVDATREACQAAARLDPRRVNIPLVVQAEFSSAVDDLTGTTCAAAGCVITLRDFSGQTPPRIVCDARVGYIPLTGVIPRVEGGDLGQVNWSDELVPRSIGATAVAIYEQGN
jgi:Flp pilus assembly protein TadG